MLLITKTIKNDIITVINVLTGMAINVLYVSVFKFNLRFNWLITNGCIKYTPNVNDERLNTIFLNLIEQFHFIFLKKRNTHAASRKVVIEK